MKRIRHDASLDGVKIKEIMLSLYRTDQSLYKITDVIILKFKKKKKKKKKKKLYKNCIGVVNVS
jgi:hypothetical protein